MTHSSRRAIVLASAALWAALSASCGDPEPPRPVPGAVAGSPIAGAPIDGTKAPAPAEPAPLAPTVAAPTPESPTPSSPTPAAPTPTQPAATDPASAEPPIVAADPAAPVAPAEPPVAIVPAMGDPSTRDERRPEDEPVTTPAPGPAPAAPAEPAGGAADAPSPIPPTTASQSDKPSLPDKANPADATANPGAAAVDPKTGLKSFIPKDHRKDDPLVLTFEQLASFDYTPPPPPPATDPDVPAPDPAIAIAAAKKQIPHEIWELEGKVLSVEGFMIPLEYQDEGVKAFIISRHAMGCCFGIMPRPHEMIECDLGEGKSTPYIGYIPVIVTGVFRVNLPTGTQTMLTGIYRMDSPKISLPKER